MRIAMLQDEWWPRPGGGGVHVRELSTALATEYGHTVDIFTRAVDGHRSTERYADGAVTVHRRPPATSFHNPVGRAASLVSLVPTLRRSYDVVHGHTILPGVPTKLAGALTGVPTVFTVHGTSLANEEGLYASSPLSVVNEAFKRLVLLRFDYDHVVSVSEDRVDMLADHQSAVSTIPNGVDIDRFERTDARGDKRVLFVGRLTPVKQVDDLVAAFEQVLDDHPDAELVIVGSGPSGQELREQVRSAGLSASVTFEGQVDYDEVPEYYANASVFVLPSQREGNPISLLESWAAGLPVLATDVQGTRQFVDDGETGRLVPSSDPDALADALAHVFENPSAAERWGENGRRLIETTYSWTAVAGDIDQVYRAVTDP